MAWENEAGASLAGYVRVGVTRDLKLKTPSCYVVVDIGQAQSQVLGSGYTKVVGAWTCPCKL